jgi:6-phosphofructo-2-kinase / fructose-2,6-biphosphatase 3
VHVQICRSGLSSNRRIWLTRHGESEFNRKGLIGGDAELTDKGKKYADALALALCQLVPYPDDEEELLTVSCWTSTLRRTIQTAKLVPFPKLRWKALDEIHAGICDGHTYEEIKEKWPETYAARKADKLNFRYPAGESYMDVVSRLESCIIEVERESESVCIVGHQAILRVLYSYFMQVPRTEVFPCLRLPALNAAFFVCRDLLLNGQQVS